MVGVEIRFAEANDAKSIESVLADAFIEYKSVYTAGGYAATTPSAERVRDRMEEGPVWVALLDGAIVGTVAAAPRGEALYVRSMAVLPVTRGKGIGRLLLNNLESYAAAHGYKRLFLSTTPFLAGAIGLYEGAGFQRTNDGPHDLFGTPLFTMEKNLVVED